MQFFLVSGCHVLMRTIGNSATASKLIQRTLIGSRGNPLSMGGIFSQLKTLANEFLQLHKNIIKIFKKLFEKWEILPVGKTQLQLPHRKFGKKLQKVMKTKTNLRCFKVPIVFLDIVKSIVLGETFDFWLAGKLIDRSRKIISSFFWFSIGDFHSSLRIFFFSHFLE